VEASARTGGGAAVVKLRSHGRGETFVAERCEETGAAVTATGRTRRSTGIDYADTQWGPPRTYSWRRRDVDTIRWLEGGGT
jgi:hypothetical protein